MTDSMGNIVGELIYNNGSGDVFSKGDSFGRPQRYPTDRH
jgi:hypothetical protein